MRSAIPQLQNLARRLLALEASSRNTREAEGSAAFYVCEKLRQPLSTLAGVAGFRSLLSRALTIAGDEVRWLKAVKLNANGSLEGLDEAQLSAAEIAEGEAVLVAQLIGLLVTFIGATLTLQLLQQAWPEASLGGLNSEPEKERSRTPRRGGRRRSEIPSGNPDKVEIRNCPPACRASMRSSAAACRSTPSTSSPAARAAARPRWRIRSCSPMPRRSGPRSISPCWASRPSRCCATSSSSRSSTDAKLDGAIRFINLSQVVLEQDLGAVLEEIVKEVEAAKAGIVVVDSFRTVVRKAPDDASEVELQGFVQRLALAPDQLAGHHVPDRRIRRGRDARQPGLHRGRRAVLALPERRAQLDRAQAAGHEAARPGVRARDCTPSASPTPACKPSRAPSASSAANRPRQAAGGGFPPASPSWTR